jgi:hypothetical protein
MSFSYLLSRPASIIFCRRKFLSTKMCFCCSNPKKNFALYTNVFILFSLFSKKLLLHNVELKLVLKLGYVILNSKS